MATLKEDLAVQAELVETHISWVFLGEADVLKVKKPVDFGFLDFRDLEARRRACEAEVRLNARLAPGVYFGVLPIRRAPGGTHYAGAGEDPIVDWAVRMRRLPDAHRADTLLGAGQLGAADLDRIAARIADFHAACRADEETARYGSREAISGSVEENFAQVGAALERYVSAEEAAELIRAQRAMLVRHADIFARRAAAGRVRDGHGDLRLEHVYLGPGGEVNIIDCIEFNDRFRYGDVCSDVAFLSMDLAHFGAVNLAERLIAQYARASNDFDLYALIDFYEAYRACVRGKIAHFVASDPALPAPARQEAERRARSYFLLALSTERRALLKPSLVCVGGIIASGKSTLAEIFADELGAPIVDADRTRKHMLGVEPTAPVRNGAWSGAYDPDFTDTVYGEVLRRAAVVLASGRPVIIDASFRSARLRLAARALARKHGVSFAFVECTVPLDVARARLAQRAAGESVSDGRAEILESFVARYEPVTELAESEHIVVDTSSRMDEQLRALRARIATWPRGLSA